MKKPHLVVIQRTADGIALAGECSSCGIKYHFQVGGEQADNERKLQELFDQHFKHMCIFARTPAKPLPGS